MKTTMNFARLSAFCMFAWLCTAGLSQAETNRLPGLKSAGLGQSSFVNAPATNRFDVARGIGEVSTPQPAREEILVAPGDPGSTGSSGGSGGTTGRKLQRLRFFVNMLADYSFLLTFRS